ncbi:PSdsA [Oceaniovalibus guishaninsula JLT2003]|uniref:Linear primary-alkylsulfatase n=1 Tax=Oceaniovalibus guishaninsula JLT2003 TaxID=1231392 RepID=K2H8Y8_9RHOB|nr:alkyl sulfatase dimerization domain-containing protein [Oceaniovalibus guishaninsula]EKE43062.1 PSdsA [Oceaniovalibus guishaninsula JLT2003]
MRQTYRAMLLACAMAVPVVPATAQEASESTKAANRAVLDALPFDDRTDFEDAERGFIAPLPGGSIADADGRTVWDVEAMDFLQGDAPDTANPSLWRQGKLNHITGLFEVTDGIYQVRNFDLSVMSFIRGDSGWIVVDPLISTQTAAAGWALLREKVADLPVSAVILTHSHADHFGGIKGIVTPEEVAARDIPVIAPEGFVEEAIGENLIAGNAMSRRASYMFGNLLPKGPEGMIGSGLGTTTSSGTITLIEPTIVIADTPTEMEVDGVEMVFLNTPGAEAPSEFMFWLPAHKALMQAEIINHVLHNLYTLRGTKVRSGDLWAKYIHDVIGRYGDAVEVSFGSHHWPTWGNAEIVEFWEKHRDTYRYIHDETLRLANKGLTMLEIAEEIALPESLATEFANRGYYGTVSHNAKAQYQLYFGWFSGNPAELHELPPAEEGAAFVRYAGGADAVIDKARADHDAGNYRWAATALNHLVFADSENTEARELLADVYTQLGYQAESGPWRNFYLTGAQELRQGVTRGATAQTASADIIRSVPIEMYLDYLAMRLDHPRAADADIALNFVMPDVDETFAVEVANGVMNYRMDVQEDDAQATVTLDRATLDRINLQQTTFPDAIAAGDVTIEGDRDRLMAFLGLLDDFEFWFDIVTD